MSKPEAEAHFLRGMIFLKKDNYQRAAECFGEAVRIDRSQKLLEKDPKYMSYYGLCLALGENKVSDGLGYCQKAIKEDVFQPDFYLNLGKVYLKKGSKRKAVKAFRQGLELDKDNEQIKKEIKQLGERKEPFFPSLPRSHPFNKYLGLLLARFRSK
ncbi:MAG: tetratricopeptide repeat protein [Deltaproteobacteria bacterium]|nr:MAG: tetratricopeptide repeat protein [Deltaproteobacteria bacterium]